MDAIIPQINEIQELFATAGQANVFETVQFPNIVVVGEQSAGKSSVLEGIVGQDFLPRGIDMVTRTPLVIQLNHVTKEDPKRNREPKPIAGDWVEFSHKRGEIFEDFKKVREEIEAQTVKLAGDGKNISNEAIVLKLFSSRVVNLSLVDLPGLVKNPYPDQPLDIEEQIRNLVLEYITNPNSIILAITPATQDLAASESLKIASQVDKDGHRTLAVLTKLDRMDNGTNASEILTKRVQLPRNIKLGMIGVVNRSQQDIQDGKALSAQLNTEKEFLFKHYPGICHQNGVPFLTKTLNELLMKHISACLPPLQQRLETMKSQYENQVTSFDKPVNNKEETMLSIITEFCKEFLGLGLS
uniref:Dynamin-type G domain-containing protein n=1 Tax=Acrobeloides nanus TaxID=290746 RepID=A0A914CF07_9BILA